MKGPPKSTAVCAKGWSANQSLIYGRGAIICFGKLHFFSQARISSCPDIIHNRVDRTASVWFTPLAWFPSWWKYFTINFVTWCLRGRIIGKRASWDKNSAYLRRLSHLVWPSSSNHGFLKILHLPFFSLKGFFHLFNCLLHSCQLGITERLTKIRWSLLSDFWKHPGEYNPLIRWVSSREEQHFSTYSLSRWYLIVCLFP